jgi:23S rRNA pseudouridine1911/1915/1917 synthase
MPAMTALRTLRSFDASAEQAGQRLDHFLRAQLPGLSRRALLEHFGAGEVRVNGRVALKSLLLQQGDRIEVAGLVAESGPAPDASLALHVLYEDAFLVAVDKPGHVPSHALRAGETGTVVSALLARYPEMRTVGYRELEAGLLHRLDNETSGILLAARDASTFERLRSAHERGQIEKRYLALVSGHPQPRVAHGYLRADRRKVRVRSEPFPEAKPVQTEIVSSEPQHEHALVCVRLQLAARHQVRAHLAHLGHPIAGDSLYGGPSLPGLSRHFLHASELRFQHPHDGTPLELKAELPADLRALL